MKTDYKKPEIEVSQLEVGALLDDSTNLHNGGTTKSGTAEAKGNNFFHEDDSDDNY